MGNIQEIIKNEKYALSGDGKGILTCFLNPVLREIGRRYRIAVIVCPGGGYGKIVGREADVVARRYQAYGLQAFVLRYSTGAGQYRRALGELSGALELIRRKADEWDIDRDKIAICGFSAGGHLALSLGCFWNKKRFGEIAGKAGPNALCLCYPVVSAGRWKHGQSVENCLADRSLRQEDISLELHVDGAVPPVFLWHNADDGEVPVQNAIMLMEKLSEANVPYEAHIFPQGGHGLALCDMCTAMTESQIDEVCGQWFLMSLQWMRRVLE